MKFFRNCDRKTAIKHLPKFLSLPRGGLEGAFDLFIFTEQVVTSKAVRKAQRLSSGLPLVAAAASFTDEAVELLKKDGALVVEHHRSNWTDSEWNERHIPYLKKLKPDRKP